MEKGFNDHKFISKISNRDPYNLLHPDSNDYYSSTNSGKFYVEIEFESEKKIKGIIIKSYFTKYIKGFKVIADDMNEVYSTDGIDELNQKYGESKIYFEPCKCKKIKIQQNGLNYDGTNFVRLKKIDVITEDNPDGYFKSIIKEYNDVHLFPVKLKFDCISTEDFYLIDSSHSLSTWFGNGTDGHFEIKLLSGLAYVEGYRLKRNPDSEKMKSWEIYGNQNEDDDEWIKLDWRNDDANINYPLCEVFEMKVKMIVKRIKIVQIEKTFDDKCIFRFNHFDIFGRFYFLD